MSSSSQALVRVGAPLDLYYTDESNCLKQSIPTEVNTRYTQDFSNKGAGVSVFTLSPNAGYGKVILVLGYNASSINTQVGDKALERGWGYKALAQISFRISGSSQYFLTGSQLLARNMRLCRTKTQRDAILALGGQECKVATDFDVAQYAYIPLSLWNTPSDDGLNIPLSSDLLSSQIQITAQLNPTSAFWAVDGATVIPAPVAAPAAFDIGYLQCEQIEMRDKSMSLANRIDMNSHMYSMPLPTFDQQEFTSIVPVQNTEFSAVLSGFRAGELKKLQVYFTQNTTDAIAGGSSVANNNFFYAPRAITMLYAGQVYSQFNDGTSAIWNLLGGTAPSAVDQSALFLSAGAWNSAPVLSQWAELPFAQSTSADHEADILVHGKEILNGILNLQVIPPAAPAVIGVTSSWTMHVIYVYNATVAFSRGSAELLF